MGSGKDTAFSFIELWAAGRGLSAVRHALADKLKLSACAALGLTTNQHDALVIANQMKFTGVISIDCPEVGVMHQITGREFLQRYGTEAHRDIFDDEFWVNALLPKGVGDPWGWQRNFEGADYAVVTDVRFENEAQRIRDLGGVVWKVVRPDAELEGAKHASELGIPAKLVDRELLNNTDIENFRREVFVAMEKL